MTRLSAAEIQLRTSQLRGWTLEGDCLVQVFRFRDFIQAIKFVDSIVFPAESAAHHPDLMISYNKVTVSITTHDAGGLTHKDFELAAAIDILPKPL
jgi:4a-hydroxytetrahydrobiopterin dehydratase